jgi:hypothetical protein
MFAKSEFVEKHLRKKHRVGRCGYPLCDGGEGGKLLGCSLCRRPQRYFRPRRMGGGVGDD